MICKEPTIYKGGAPLDPQVFQDATKSYTFKLLTKYQTYFGTFSVRLNYNFLIGIYVVTGTINPTSNFTPSYSSSDPAGNAPWPCVAELDFDEEPIKNASGNFLFGDIINPSPYINLYKIEIQKTAKKAFLIMSANKALPGGNWFDFYNASSF